jgi:hypothetical protein
MLSLASHVRIYVHLPPTGRAHRWSDNMSLVGACQYWKGRLVSWENRWQRPREPAIDLSYGPESEWFESLQCTGETSTMPANVKLWGGALDLPGGSTGGSHLLKLSINRSRPVQ